MSEFHGHGHITYPQTSCHSHDLSPHKHWDEHDLQPNAPYQNHSHELPVSCACKECCQAFAHRHSFTPGSTRCLQAVSFISKLATHKHDPEGMHRPGVVYETPGGFFQYVCAYKGPCPTPDDSCDHCRYSGTLYL